MKRLMVVCLALSSLAMAQTTVFGATPNAVDNLTVSGTLAVGTTVQAPNIRNLDSRLQAERFVPVVDWLTTTAPNAAAPLTITPYIGTELVHPDVYFNPNGWNGHRFWMAVTPYKDTQAQYENPSLYVSEDGQTWTTPSGVTNPIVPYTVGTTNSDPDLVDGLDGKLYLFYRTFDSYDTLYYRSSSDGVNWDSPKQTLRVLSTTERLASPAVLYDGTTWTLYYVDVVPATYVVKKRTAPSPDGPWSDPVVISLPVNGGGRQYWHMDAYNFMGQTLLFLNVSAGAQELYIAWSNDGTNFTFNTVPVLAGIGTGHWDKFLYRASIVPMLGANGVKLAIWYSAMGDDTGSDRWRVGYTEATVRSALVRSTKFSVGSGSASIETSGTTDIVVKDGAGNQAFRSVKAGAFADSAQTQYFQIGAASGHAMFTAASGGSFGRFAIVANTLSVGRGTISSTPAPAGGSLQEWIGGGSGNVVGTVDSAGKATFNGGAVLPNIKATTGTRFVCVDTNGTLVSQTTACSGT